MEKFKYIILSIALIATSLILRDGFLKFKSAERIVDVKGLSERVVKSNQAQWTMSFSVRGDDLKKLNNDFKGAQSLIIQFLSSKGFTAQEIQKSAPQYTDNVANNYSNQKPEFKFTLRGSVTVVSSQIDLVSASSEQTDDLFNLGLAIENSYLKYYFTDLNTLKPEMIKEATQNARDVAQKFADDSMSALGEIKSASQGLFSISDVNSDEYTNDGTIMKKVRVVTQISYYLK